MGGNSTKFDLNKSAKICLVVFCLIGFAGSLLAKEALLDRVVAVVNDEAILYSQVQGKISSGQVVVISSYPSKETDSDFEKALQDEINYELIIQKIEEYELNISDEELDSEIKGFIKKRNLTMDGLLEALHQQGMSFEQYQDDFRKQMIMRKFQGRIISPLIKITDKDVENYYLKKSGSSADFINVVLRQIFIKVPGGSNDAVTKAKKQRAQEVYAKLQGGLVFEEAVKLYSDESSAQKTGGLMAAIQLNELSKSIRAFVQPLSKGEYTPVIETPAGFYLFYLSDKTFSGSSNFKSKKKMLEYELRSSEMVNQTKKWLTERRRKSKIKVIR